MTLKEQRDTSFRFGSAGIAFERDGLVLAGGMPGVTLLLGAEACEMKWIAFRVPAAVSHARQTPLGAAEESVVFWTLRSIPGRVSAGSSWCRWGLPNRM